MKKKGSPRNKLRAFFLFFVPIINVKANDIKIFSKKEGTWKDTSKP